MSETARSCQPSASRSAIATEVGAPAVVKSVFPANVPSPMPGSTETVPEERFATARSGLASPFRSPIATERGKLPTV